MARGGRLDPHLPTEAARINDRGERGGVRLDSYDWIAQPPGPTNRALSPTYHGTGLLWILEPEGGESLRLACSPDLSQQTLLCGTQSGLCPIVDFELLVDGRELVLHRLLSKEEQLGDLLVGPALPHLLKDGPFLGRETSVSRPG